MADQQTQQQREKEKEPFLHLDLAPHEKEPGRETYRVTAEIWLSRWSGSIPRVQIRVDGVLWQGQDFYPLDQQRCLTANITGLTLGVHTLVVVTEDGRHRNMKPINIPVAEKKFKLPGNVSVTVSGPRGKQKLSIAVASSEGDLISGFAGKIMDGDRFLSFTTGPEGVFVHEMDFQDENRAVEVRTGNKPEQIWNGVLLGPKSP